MGNNLIAREAITKEQENRLLQGLEAGLSLVEAADASNILFLEPADLLDLVNSPAVQAAVNKAVHNQIMVTGKQIAWSVARELMQDRNIKAATRWAAARWVLEASGEGIGSTRAQRNKTKELHEMTEEELTRFIANARALVDKTAIDITPEKEDYEGLFD